MANHLERDAFEYHVKDAPVAGTMAELTDVAPQFAEEGSPSHDKLAAALDTKVGGPCPLVELHAFGKGGGAVCEEESSGCNAGLLVTAAPCALACSGAVCLTISDWKCMVMDRHTLAT